MANATIEGFNFTLFFDYDYHREKVLQRLSDEGKISWLEARTRMIFLDPMITLFDRSSKAHEELNTPQYSKPRTGTLLLVSLLMNGIEAFGSFLNSNNSKKDNFYAFINKYMFDWKIQITTPLQGKTALSEILWKSYRNGLAHSFAIEGAGIDPVAGKGKYKIEDNILQIDIWKFFDDFRKGVEQMFKDFRNDTAVKKRFLKRFKNVYKC